MSNVRVGTFPVAGRLSGGAPERQAWLEDVAAAGIDHACVGDHVSFFVGVGSDGVVAATSLLAAHPSLPVYVALYLLPLRHPVPVARQLSTIAELAPGRLTFGVGLGGEDRHEIEVCGVDPRTRGRRMDEHLTVLRALGAGKPVTFHGEFVSVDDALVLPAPSPPVPLVVGGRSEAAVRRAGRLGDGWLAIWVSPRRFGSAVEQVESEAAAAGREDAALEHGLNVWCGFAPTRAAARSMLAAGMEGFYRIPFESFERYSPHGTPEEVAEFLAPYVDAGCRAINVIPCAGDDEAAIGGVAELRRLLAG